MVNIVVFVRKFKVFLAGSLKVWRYCQLFKFFDQQIKQAQLKDCKYDEEKTQMGSSIKICGLTKLENSTTRRFKTYALSLIKHSCNIYC